MPQVPTRAPASTGGAATRRSRRRRRARLLKLGGLAVLAAAILWPASAMAASSYTPFPLPSSGSWTTWWAQIQKQLSQAGWTLPVGGGSTTTPPPTPPPTSPPSGGGGSTGGGGTTSPTSGTGATVTGSYTNSSGTRSYTAYVPSTYKAGTAMPLVVVLHGCTESSDVIAQLTRFDQLAETKGFIAVFPQQPSSANYESCWNFFQDADMHRGSGEPSLIAGITQQVQQNYTVNAKQTYVAGLSAGGAMASVMGATYPDIYAAIGVGSGCEYDATAACAGYQSTDPTTAGKAAYTEMGSRARVLPVIAFQGDADTTVPPINGTQLVQQWLTTDDLADDGAANGSIGTTAAKTTQGQVPNGRSYTVSDYDDSHGGEVLQYWLVHGMNHAWSGGSSSESYADPQGPDATSAMYQFFMAHPMP
ncbi:MAG TPA: PHB depolymerase family esterase [Baekduia sp.]